MGLTDRLSDGLETIAQQAQKALEQGRVRVEQLQVERQMDAVARRLGYLEFDAAQGRTVDEEAKGRLLRELAELEQELHSSMQPASAEAAGTAPSEETPASEGGAPPTAATASPGTDMAEAERIAQAAAAAGVQPGSGPSGQPAAGEGETPAPGQVPAQENEPPKEG
jgi:hypothetical protein